MTMHAHYPTKKALKASVGKRLLYSETSIIGVEYKSNGSFVVCDPSHKWFAKVTMANDLIVKVE